MTLTTVRRLAVLFSIMLVSGAVHASLWDWLTGRKATASAPQGQVAMATYGTPNNALINPAQVGTPEDFAHWLNENPYERQTVYAYDVYWQRHLGRAVPMHELLTTARSWQACGFERYAVPPRELWTNIIPTLNLYYTLQWQGVLPTGTQIRSVYRSPDLNACAGGAPASKHLTNGAIDIWVPTLHSEAAILDLKDNLCQFWRTNGQMYHFGLGLYATGAIHLDTQGYRKWGAEYTRADSPCRDTPVYP